MTELEVSFTRSSRGNSRKFEYLGPPKSLPIREHEFITRRENSASFVHPYAFNSFFLDRSCIIHEIGDYLSFMCICVCVFFSVSTVRQFFRLTKFSVINGEKKDSLMKNFGETLVTVKVSRVKLIIGKKQLLVNFE